MKFCSISSGSSGNCIYAGSDTTSVLVDAGISGARIERGLNEIDMTTKDMDGILVTHEHSDHIKGIGVLARRYGLPIYATKGTIDYIKESTSIGKIPTDLLHVICADMDFEIGDLRIHPFRIYQTWAALTIILWIISGIWMSCCSNRTTTCICWRPGGILII